MTDCDFRSLPRVTKSREVLDILQSPRRMMVNRYPGVCWLTRKDTFSSLIRLRNILDPACSVLESIEPRSFMLPEQVEEWQECRNADKKAIFIAKPRVGSEGNNCLLFNKLDELPSILKGNMIVQRYIANPLLLDGLKFDLRVYVLVTGIVNPQVYICEEGLARLCTEAYEPPTKANFNDFFKHLTNYSINKHHDEYQDAYSKRTLTSCFESLARRGVDVGTIIRNIKETCTKAM